MPLLRSPLTFFGINSPLLSSKERISSPSLISLISTSSHSSIHCPFLPFLLFLLFSLVSPTTHCPTTCRLARGEVVPIPTLPLTPSIAPDERAEDAVPQPNNPPPFTCNAAPATPEVPMPIFPFESKIISGFPLPLTLKPR